MKIKSSMSTVSKVTSEARDHGMSYGAWVGREWLMTVQSVHERFLEASAMDEYHTQEEWRYIREKENMKEAV